MTQFQSRIRVLVNNMANSARDLRIEASTDRRLQATYNSFCDILDRLNEELKEEDQGLITPTWSKFP